MTREEWHAEGVRRFGPDQARWRFVCPSCGWIASVQDYKDAGAPLTSVAFSCVGRWTDSTREAFAKGTGPCNYAGGGLIRLNPLTVDGEDYFDFAKADTVQQQTQEAD